MAVDGIKKLFKHFTNTHENSIISYCDNSKFDGDIYKKLGFTLQTFGKPNKHWYNSKYGIHITDNLLRQHGFDRLVGNIFGKYGKGTSNKQLMLDNKFVEIYDSGQSTYVYEKLN